MIHWNLIGKKIIEGLDKALKLAADGKSMERENQVSLFQFLSTEEEEKSRTQLQLPDIQDWKTKIRLKHEKKLWGSIFPVIPWILI